MRGHSAGRISNRPRCCGGESRAPPILDEDAARRQGTISRALVRRAWRPNLIDRARRKADAAAAPRVGTAARAFHRFELRRTRAIRWRRSPRASKARAPADSLAASHDLCVPQSRGAVGRALAPSQKRGDDYRLAAAADGPASARRPRSPHPPVMRKARAEAIRAPRALADESGDPWLPAGRGQG